MPALAERTKIRSASNSSTTIEGLGSSDLLQIASAGRVEFLPIDVHAYELLSASTSVALLPYLHQPSSQAKELLKKLYSFKKLPDNWDGNGAVPPNESTINKAAAFINFTDEFDAPLYFTALGPNGEIVLEYKMENHMSEVFFNEDESEEMILYTGNAQQYCGAINPELLKKHFQQ